MAVVLTRQWVKILLQGNTNVPVNFPIAFSREMFALSAMHSGTAAVSFNINDGTISNQGLQMNAQSITAPQAKNLYAAYMMFFGV